MLIYSVVPPEIVLTDVEGRPAATDAVPLTAGGAALVLVRRLAGQGAVIERVVSTDPRHFLDPSLTPGQPWPRPTPPST